MRGCSTNSVSATHSRPHRSLRTADGNVGGAPGYLEPVFASMLENAIRLCGANSGSIYRRDGDVFDLVAAHNLPPAFADYRRHFPISTNEKTPTGRMVLTK